MGLKDKQILKPLAMPKFNPVWKDVEGDWCRNESLASVPFSPLESRMAKEKPGLSDGLEKLRSMLGEENFRKFISPLHNLTKNGNMLLIRIMKQNIKCSVVIQTGQRIVHGFISKAITPRPFCVQKYVRSPWLMVQKETLKI